jgi:hypothetical protein
MHDLVIRGAPLKFFSTGGAAMESPKKTLAASILLGILSPIACAQTTLPR